MHLSSEKTPSEDLAPWRSPLSRAIHRNRALAFSRFLQLATVRTDGTPANRTVVFRGFLESTNQLMFVSDRRSEKTEQIQQNPNAEACWYFTKTREQFRLAGQLRLITVNTADDWTDTRKRLWQKISDSARLQFAWPQPKASRANDEAFAPPSPDESSPPPTFSVLCLAVNTVDHLELRGEPQSRCLYKKVADGQWETAAVNP